MDHDDSFANVSWQSDPNAPPTTNLSRSAISPRMEPQEAQNGKRRGSGGQLGHNALDLDLAGVGEGVLECTVTSPIKENDGSKDAYVSYLVTTNVCPLTLCPFCSPILLFGPEEE
jgi:sorting nexin-4